MISLLNTLIMGIAQGAVKELARGAPTVKSLLDPSTYSPPAPVPESTHNVGSKILRVFFVFVLGVIALTVIYNMWEHTSKLVAQQKSDRILMEAFAHRKRVAAPASTSSDTTSNDNENQMSQAEHVESAPERATETPQSDWVPLSSGTLY